MTVNVRRYCHSISKFGKLMHNILLQIHRTADGTIKIFSRNCEEHSKKFPDVLLMLPEIVSTYHL